MAKLLISCDNYLYCKDGKYYFKDAEWCDFYSRYLRVFEKIRIVNRVVEETDVPAKRVLIDNPNIEVVHVPFFSGPLQYAKNYFKVGTAIKNVTQDCDAAVIRLPSTIGQRVCNEVLEKGIPYAIEAVCAAWDMCRTEHSPIRKLLWNKIDHDMKRSCYCANGVSCVTASYLQKRYFSKRKDAFYSNYSTLALSDEFYLHPRKSPTGRSFVIANVANQIQWRKGFKEILQAIAILKKRGIVVTARFVGADYHGSKKKLERAALKLGISSQIEYAGYLSRSEIDVFYNNVDLFVMPTRAEGLPRVVIEALAKGLPVITSPVSGNPELVSKHFLVNYDDVNTLADRIEELVTNSSLYESTSRENFVTSQQYRSDILQSRRDLFYQKLKSVCNKVGGGITD